MKDSLENAVSSFLQQHYDPTRPVLLALSGGPDSLSLLHLLLRYRKKNPLQLGVAHVDHHWRPESSGEAEVLRMVLERLKVPFHLKEIDPKKMEGNLEAACRQERLKFFHELCEKYKYQSVFLGHHADDQAETVLKRVLEGANLPYLAGLQPVNDVEGVTVWRPLLQVSRASIVKWLKDNHLDAFTDPTNLDPKYLRGRFRTQIIPDLAKNFGKEVSSSLCHLAEEAQELRNHLKDELKKYLMQIQRGAMGSLLDLSEECPSSPFAIKFLLRELCRESGYTLNRDLTDTAFALFHEGKADRQLATKDFTLHIDRRRLFIMKNVEISLPSKQPLPIGQSQYGDWRITTTSVENYSSATCNWIDVWKGKVEVTVPDLEYAVGPPVLSAPYPNQSAPLSKWWTNEKVPAFLRQSIPVLWSEERICHEFLTGRKSSKDGSGCIRIQLEYLPKI